VIRKQITYFTSLYTNIPLRSKGSYLLTCTPNCQWYYKGLFVFKSKAKALTFKEKAKAKNLQ